MDPNTVVFDISSDEEVDWGETTGSCGGDDDDFGWISELLGEVDREADDSDDADDDCVVLSAVPKSLSAFPNSSTKDADDDDDCVVLDGNPDKPVAIQNDTVGESDDLLVVSEKGQIACRDYPHPRHLCAKFPFISTPHERHCDQCHCYVCDLLAPCVHWGIGVSSIDHCHATDKEEFWKHQRKSSKKSDKAPQSIPNVPETSLAMGLSQMGQVPLLISQNHVSRSSSIRACSTTTNLGIPNIISHGRSQRSGYVVPRNKFQPYLVSQQLHSSCNTVIQRDRRHTAGNLGPQFLYPHALFKRPGSAGVALTTNQLGYSTSNNYRSHYSGNPPVATPTDKNPVRWQDFHGGPTSESNTCRSSSQPNIGRVIANSAFQPDVSRISANSVPSPPPVSSQTNLGSMIANSAASQPQLSSQLYTGSILANSVPSQPQVSSQANVGSTFANSLPSLPQVYSQPISASSDSHNVFQQGSQTQSAMELTFMDYLSWTTPAGQNNQEHPAENSPHQAVERTDELLLSSGFDLPFCGSTNRGSLDFEFDSLISGNQPISGALEESVPPGLNGFSTEPASIDAGNLFDF